MSELSTKQIAYLRGLGQRLEPTVHFGQAGLTDALLASLNQTLDNQELVKVKLHAHKEEKKQLAPQLAERSANLQRVVTWCCSIRPAGRSSETQDSSAHTTNRHGI
ncbi:MAG: YhbY family RNA-binding protein [Verrucomicrobiota bacterium]